MSNLYQDAILDAKALRASAMANAKAALEEAFEPKIQEMISKHLAEDAEEDVDQIEDDYAMEEEGAMADEKPMEETVDINEAELEEILNQLEEMSAPKEESLNEASEEEEGEEKEEAGEEEEEEGEEEEEEADEDSADEGEEVGDDTKIIDITLGDLKQVIQSLMPGEAMPAAEEPTADSEAEAEVSLEEILDELAAEGLEEEFDDIEDVHTVDTTGYEAGQQAKEGLQEKRKKTAGAYSNTITVADKKAEKKDAKNGAELTGKNADHGYNKVVKESEQELEEAKATIETLRKDLQEVNLLNAKYLYMNKLFKSNSLTESQKLQVINALDRATSVKEVKSTYDVMKESFEKKKSPLKESIGFASKPAGVAPKANIVEADSFINRWQKLAGIK
jgi:hypothetical protein